MSYPAIGLVEIDDCDNRQIQPDLPKVRQCCHESTVGNFNRKAAFQTTRRIFESPPIQPRSRAKAPVEADSVRLKSEKHGFVIALVVVVELIDGIAAARRASSDQGAGAVRLPVGLGLEPKLPSIHQRYERELIAAMPSCRIRLKSHDGPRLPDCLSNRHRG